MNSWYPILYNPCCLLPRGRSAYTRFEITMMYQWWAYNKKSGMFEFRWEQWNSGLIWYTSIVSRGHMIYLNRAWTGFGHLCSFYDPVWEHSSVLPRRSQELSVGEQWIPCPRVPDSEGIYLTPSELRERAVQNLAHQHPNPPRFWWSRGVLGGTRI